ncbi:hypothetical protein XELAEV_18008576mg, partial [Xenopus laevis]
MAAADLRDELSCFLCLSIYTDPVSLPCGHNFCHGCIERVLGTQEGSGGYSCPECKEKYQERPALLRNRTLGNIAERFRPTETEPGETGIFCTYCVLSPVPAAKSCLLCEASLCDTHLRGHSKSAEHVLTQPTDSFMERKCSVHNELLKYYCCEDSGCVCVSCCLAGEHRGHRVKLLSEASEKKKEKLRKVLEKLRTEREETERGAQRLQERRREVAEKAAGEIERLEIKKDELSRKIPHIEELCNMADPLTVLQERESHGAADNEGARERHDIKVPAVGDLDVDLISETLLTGLAAIVTWVKGRIYGQEATDLLLDINTAGNDVSVSGDRKSASYSLTDQCHPQTPERFQFPQ